jgi:tRNA dimethylallyltransferase
MSEVGGSEYPAIAVMGPTASGKTVLGEALAERFHGEIVTCDALQVYRYMDIGTAKPSAHGREKIPHHMLDLRSPCDDFSAGDYQRLGRDVLRTMAASGRIPFVVGGTGFYLRALIDGLFEGPGRSDELRTRMRRIIAGRGAASLHHALGRVDPEIAERLAPADAERIMRAYEIYLLSGRTMSWWQSRPKNRLAGYRWLKLGIRWPRKELYARIGRRVEEMFERGFVAEVQALVGRFPRDCHAFRAIGYRQIIAHLEGRSSLEQAIEDTERESRRYAKRQLTWFHADPEVLWLDATPGPDALLAQAGDLVARFLA